MELRTRRPRGTAAAGRGGFTLVEVMVTVGLLAIVVALLLVPIVNSFRYFRSATARADAQTAARIALDAVSRELTEAMYIQLDMYDSSMIAFVPPLRVDPDDPNSEIVTPPRPDWSREIRIWRALYDPTMNYDPAGHSGPGNPYFLARTELRYPFTYEDAWNRWNGTWAEQQNAAGAQGITRWAPIPRVVHSDVDYRVWRPEGDRQGMRTSTLQPGYPYLWVQYLLDTSQTTSSEAVRLYRNRVVALTPNAVDYDVSRLEFGPTVVAGEWLRPVEGAGRSDRSVYRARYPLWRLGARYTGWAELSEDPYLDRTLSALDWARDPFLLVYRFDQDETGGWSYVLRAVGAFDPRTRTMKVIDVNTGGEVYDSGLYPYRPAAAWKAFGVDWIDGSLRCDFPPPNPLPGEMEQGLPLRVSGGQLMAWALAEPVQDVYDYPLLSRWEDRNGADTLVSFLVEDTVRVRADTNADGVPDRTLSQVFCTPRDGLDEFQVGLDPLAQGFGDATEATPRYGWIRLPATLSGGLDAAATTLWVDFRWRDNGVVPPGGALEDEQPDLISAYYRTVAVLDVGITVTRADPGATGGQRITQSAQLTRRVKVRNLLREIRYED
jgi:prepilin-type N-terminal cleavage/methylation domain-containing protein